MTIFTVNNEFLINDYLEKYKPDFILINEVGERGKRESKLY
jgi:hypothetical protein